jgi:two-component system, NarL family, nitrate/nitrite response regulator NarL
MRAGSGRPAAWAGNRIGLRDGARQDDDAGLSPAVGAIAVRLILGAARAIFLDALSSVLAQRGYEVGAVARSPQELIALVRHQRPDACLIDCNLAVGEGIETIRGVVEASADTTVIVLSADSDIESAERAMDAGASGYLHQSRGVEVLVSALERVLNGERVVDVPGGRSRSARPATHADSLAASLTGRERECLSLLVAGLDTAAMVERMGVSRTTVRTHLQAVLTKLCVHSRLEAASFAVRHRLVDAWTEPAAAAISQPARPLAMSGAGPDLLRQRSPAAGRNWRRAAMHAVGQEPRTMRHATPGPTWPGPGELAASG